MTGMPLLKVSGLTITRQESSRDAVHDVSFEVPEGSVLGIIGESGAGKTSLALALIGLLDREGTAVSGKIVFRGQDLLELSEEELCSLRGNGIAMIFQDSTGALDPSMRVIDQVAETVMLHQDVKKREARELAISVLLEAGISPDVIESAPYAHQLSGGLCQRAMIAAALVARPAVLVADEPTSALDVTLQSQIISMLKVRKLETGMAIVFISHDLALVSGFADTIMVLHEGQIVERASTEELLAHPVHYYTKQLISAWGFGSIGGGTALASR